LETSIESAVITWQIPRLVLCYFFQLTKCLPNIWFDPSQYPRNRCQVRIPSCNELWWAEEETQYFNQYYFNL